MTTHPTLTSATEALIVRDRQAWLLAIDITTLLAPEVRDADKIRAAGKLVDLMRLVAPSPVVHVWDNDRWGSFTAACGQDIDANEHLARTPLDFAAAHRDGANTCTACLHLLEPA